jgi:hypothetical protein
VVQAEKRRTRATTGRSESQVRTVAQADLSADELGVYGRLVDVVAARLEEGEEVARFVVHGAELVAFTDRRILAIRRGVFDYTVRRPRVRTILYDTICDLTVERIGQSAGQLRVSIAGRRRPIRLYFPPGVAHSLALFVATRLRAQALDPV